MTTAAQKTRAHTQKRSVSRVHYTKPEFHLWRVANCPPNLIKQINTHTHTTSICTGVRTLQARECAHKSRCYGSGSGSCCYCYLKCIRARIALSPGVFGPGHGALSCLCAHTEQRGCRRDSGWHGHHKDGMHFHSKQPAATTLELRFNVLLERARTPGIFKCTFRR